MLVCCLGVSADPPSAAVKARHVCLVRRISHYQDLSAKVNIFFCSVLVMLQGPRLNFM